MQRILFHFGLVLLLAGSLPVATTLSSCSSDKKEDPKPTTGSLVGTISPAGSISTVTATDAGGLTFLATPDATTGAFSITDLKPGQYKLFFTTTPGYAQLGERSITVVAGEKAAAGTIVAESDGSLRSGTLTWTTGGTTYTSSTVTGNINDVGGAGTSLSITATANNGSRSDEISIFIGGFNLGIGTYQLGGGVYQNASYLRTNGGVLIEQYGGQNSASGTFTATTYDAATKTLTGTFGFTAADTRTSSGNSITVSNGTFTLRF